MTKQEAIDSSLLMIRQVADDAGIAINKLIEEGNSNVLFQSAEDLCSQAHDIYRLAVRLQTLEAMDNEVKYESSNASVFAEKKGE